MKTSERTVLWVVFSELYLDTALQEEDYSRIALVIAKSPFSIEDAKRIDKYEVFPLLQWNLLSAGGIWDSFDHKWLVESISKSFERRGRFGHFVVKIFYFIFEWMHKDAWQRIQFAYDAQVRHNDLPK
ncbi:DUF7079 family protein [Leptospira johnsonii]|uniref:DUF7079 domain-containing protein n=1 Tax=Leptospira johnsonii TaxID=1917820 RepID=A0A2P2D7L3_9LEPT|nr:hypothetical protein [Leptospira johnsonii]GBF40624.1 hypothetical protein LPTSP1_36420 [Leptospira johnsonii]